MSGTTTDIVVRERLADVICAAFKPFRSASEMLARASLRTPRAAENWLARKNVPDAVALIELMAGSLEIAAEVEALVAERRAARGGIQCPSSVYRSAGSASAATMGHHHP